MSLISVDCVDVSEDESEPESVSGSSLGSRGRVSSSSDDLSASFESDDSVWSGIGTWTDRIGGDGARSSEVLRVRRANGKSIRM